LIRINPRHDAFNEAGVSLPMGAKSALIAIATELDIHQ
jgi:hypothetical protein